jgi:hypothetical protein
MSIAGRPDLTQVDKDQGIVAKLPQSLPALIGLGDTFFVAKRRISERSLR